MDTRLLEDALLLLEERNLSTAAGRRHMTQPAFSRRIKALEQWIGCDLLIRKSNRVEISPGLAENEAHIRSMLAHLQQLRSQLQNPEKTCETLVIATQHSLSFSVVPDILHRLKTFNSSWCVRLRTQNRDNAMSIFLRHEADVLISYEHRNQPEAPFGDAVSSSVWHRDVLVPVVGGDMQRKLDEDNVLPSESNIITYPAESYFGKIIENHQNAQSLSLKGRVAVESANSVGVAQLIVAGIGAAWIPHSMIHDEFISGNTAILSQDYGRIPLDIVLYINQSNPKAVRFIQELYETKR